MEDSGDDDNGEGPRKEGVKLFYIFPTSKAGCFAWKWSHCSGCGIPSVNCRLAGFNYDNICARVNLEFFARILVGQSRGGTRLTVPQ